MTKSLNDILQQWLSENILNIRQKLTTNFFGILHVIKNNGNVKFEQTFKE